VRRHQISRKYTSPTIFTFVITMRLYTFYKFPPFLLAARPMLSQDVHMSVCHTLVTIKMAKHIIKLIHCQVATPFCLSTPMVWQYSDGEPPKCKGYEKITIFGQCLRPALVAQWHKSLAAVRLACVAARLQRSVFNSRLRRFVGACRSTKCIFRD